MADIRHIENRQIDIRKSSYFDEIWHTREHVVLDDSHITKYEIFKN